MEAKRACPYCTKKYTEGRSLTAHIRQMHGFSDLVPRPAGPSNDDVAVASSNPLPDGCEPGVCPYCTKKYTEGRSLTAHIRRKHGFSDFGPRPAGPSNDDVVVASQPSRPSSDNPLLEPGVDDHFDAVAERSHPKRLFKMFTLAPLTM
jgi:hypothetical protein